MNFDPLLLDALAMAFVDAAIGELEMQAQLARLRPAQPCAGCAHFVQGGVLRKHPYNTLFRVVDHCQRSGCEHTAAIGSACALQRTT